MTRQIYGDVRFDKSTIRHRIFEYLDLTESKCRSLDVTGILLEFIDGITLEDISIQSSISIQYPHIAEAALECFNKIFHFCVIHNDVRLANIMVNNGGRIYLIDFTFALFRDVEVSDEDWDRCVKE